MVGVGEGSKVQQTQRKLWLNWWGGVLQWESQLWFDYIRPNSCIEAWTGVESYWEEPRPRRSGVLGSQGWSLRERIQVSWEESVSCLGNPDPPLTSGCSHLHGASSWNATRPLRSRTDSRLVLLCTPISRITKQTSYLTTLPRYPVITTVKCKGVGPGSTTGDRKRNSKFICNAFLFFWSWVGEMKYYCVLWLFGRILH